MNLPPLEDVGDKDDIVIDRLRLAAQYIKDAQTMLISHSYNSAINRLYYSVFKAISACHALKGESYKRHKDAISSFNRDYVNEEIFPKEYGRNIHILEKLRNQSDYDDFAKISKEEVIKNVSFVKDFLKSITKYCAKHIKRPIPDFIHKSNGFSR